LMVEGLKEEHYVKNNKRVRIAGRDVSDEVLEAIERSIRDLADTVGALRRREIGERTLKRRTVAIMKVLGGLKSEVMSGTKPKRSKK
jgi:hypothetical protein